MKNNNIVLGIIFGAGIAISIGVATNSLAIGLSIGIGAALSLNAATRKQSKKCKKNLTKSKS